jgi:hypothetical protein
MIVFTTLAEKKYFNGVAALVNSMIKNGTYADKIIVGYRGDLPKWLPKLSDNNRGKYIKLEQGLIVEFIELQGDLHMVHEKPKWFHYLSHVLEPDAEEYFFFDSDIIIVNRMSFFGEWVKQGVAICEDVNYDMSASNPIRKQWINLATENNRTIVNNFSRYYNSGFLGWRKDSKKFIDDWLECSKIMNEISGDLKQFRVSDRTSVVLSANQDSLNMAAMVTFSELSIIGPEAMGFHYGLSLMLHPLGKKPWDINFTKRFFTGIKPRSGDLGFWQHVNSKVFKPYSNLTVSWKLFWIKVYRFLSRFYGTKN